MSIQPTSTESESQQEVKNTHFPKNILNPPYKKQDNAMSSLFALLPNLGLRPENGNYYPRTPDKILQEISEHAENAVTVINHATQAIASLIFLASGNEDFPMQKGDLVDVSALMHLLSDTLDAAFITKQNVDYVLNLRKKA